MKLKQTSSFLRLILCIFFLLFSINGSFAQVTNYNCYIDNITHVNSNTITFDIRIENTGTNSLSLKAFQAGINFNYSALANGGTITGASVPGYGLASIANPPLWVINPISNQIRLLPTFYNVNIPASPGLIIGKFKMSNTQPFTSVAPNFVWSFSTSTNTTSNTIILCNVNGDPTSTNITNPANQLIIGSSIPTLPQWGLIALALLILCTANFFLKKERLLFKSV